MGSCVQYEDQRRRRWGCCVCRGDWVLDLVRCNPASASHPVRISTDPADLDFLSESLTRFGLLQSRPLSLHGPSLCSLYFGSMEENCRILVSSSFQKKKHLPLHVNPLFLSELCPVGTALIITLAVKTINIWWATQAKEGLSARFY